VLGYPCISLQARKQLFTLLCIHLYWKNVIFMWYVQFQFTSYFWISECSMCDTLTFFNDSNLYGLQFSWHQGSTWPAKWNLSTTVLSDASFCAYHIQGAFDITWILWQRGMHSGVIHKLPWMIHGILVPPFGARKYEWP